MANFYKKLFVRSRKRYLTVLQQQAKQATKKAEYLASPKGLAIETVKGLPRTVRKLVRPLPFTTMWLVERKKKRRK